MSLPVVAIVGRPNVGKSTLFNRITHSRSAVVHEDSGVTRDRHVRPAEWNGRTFLLVDTGGMTPIEEGLAFEHEVTEIARDAIRHADVIIMVVDVRTGATVADEAVARELRGLDQPVFLIVNKSERDLDQYDAHVFHSLGLGEVHPVSALHGRGTGDFLDELVKALPDTSARAERTDLRVAIVGRQNVGKSSLLNRLAQESRTIVSDVPGTTRDAIDSTIRWQGHDITLIDTAGIRRRHDHVKGVEYFSVLRTIQAIQRSHVVVLLLDASAGIVAQDARVAGEVHEAGRGLVVLWNKWDLIDKDDKTYLEFEKKIHEDLAFIRYAPIHTVSATEGTRTGRILQEVWKIGEERKKTIETSRVNDVLQKAIGKNPPRLYNKGTGKVYYATQTGTGPPRFRLYVNKPLFFPRHYVRYLNNEFRKAFGYEGTRILINLRERS